MTLIEVLVAMAVFAVGILGILPMFLYATQQNRMQKDKEIISQVVVDWFGRLDALSYPDLTQPRVNELLANAATQPADPNSLTDPNTPLPIVVIHPTGLFYSVTIDVDDGDNEATWDDPNDPAEAAEVAAMPGPTFKRATIQVAWSSLLGKAYRTKVSKFRLENAPRFSNYGDGGG
jgi:prepilin-type N-terminal cleavage/methylation domain-containing protein